MDNQQILDLLNVALRRNIRDVCTLVQSSNAHFSYVDIEYTSEGFRLLISLNTGKKLCKDIPVSELGIEKTIWLKYIENPIDIFGNLVDIQAQTMAVQNIFKAQWIAYGMCAKYLRKVLSILQRTSIIPITSNIHRLINPYVQEKSHVTILRSQAHSNDVYDRTNGYLFSKGNCERDGYAVPTHIEWELVIDGEFRTIQLTAVDDLFEDIEINEDSVESLLHLYGQVLAGIMSKDENIEFVCANGKYSFVKNQSIKPKNPQQKLEFAIANALGDYGSDMIKRFERVRKVMPYLNTNGIKPFMYHEQLPVFSFDMPNPKFNKVLVGMNFILMYDAELKEFVEVLSLRKGHSLEQFSVTLRKLGLPETMQVFVQALYLNKRLPNV